MSWTTLAHVSTGELAPAATQNELLDNLEILKTSVADDGSLIDDNEAAVAIVANVLTLDLAVARHFTWTMNANLTTMTINHIPAAHRAAWFVAKVIGDGTPRTWPWFADISGGGSAKVHWASSVTPTRTSTASKFDEYMFLQYAGGSEWAGHVLDQNFAV